MRPAIRPEPAAPEEGVDLFPKLRRSRIALDHLMGDRPTLLVTTPSDNLDFDPVVLHVAGSGQCSLPRTMSAVPTFFAHLPALT